MNKEVIAAENIKIGYPQTRNRGQNCLYDNLSFNLYAGELVCLLGANGAGKSTLLRTISNSQPTLSGKILLDGKDMTTYSDRKLSRVLGLVLTDKTATGGLTAKELVELGRYPYTGFFGQLSSEDKNIIEQAMEDVGISHKASSYCAELSDGERQKAMIAKVLAQECSTIILDEPTAFLDITSRIEITNLLHDLAIKHNKTILLSTHDIELALLLADRLWLLSRNKGLQYGITEDIVLSGKLDNFFGNSNIHFDKESGSFLPLITTDKAIFLQADGYLFYWTKNLLARYGYKITDKETDALFCLNVSSPQNMQVKNGTRLIVLDSFEQLTEYITPPPILAQ